MAKRKIEKGINESIHMELLGSKTFCCDKNSSLDKLNTSKKKGSHIVNFGTFQQKSSFNIWEAYRELHGSSSLMHTYTTCNHLFSESLLIMNKEPKIMGHLRKSSSM